MLTEGGGTNPALLSPAPAVELKIAHWGPAKDENDYLFYIVSLKVKRFCYFFMYVLSREIKLNIKSNLIGMNS